MRKPLRRRAHTPLRSRVRNRILRRRIVELVHEREALLSELESTYEALLLGQETEVLNRELKSKILLLEESKLKAEQLNSQLNSAYNDLREFTFQIMKTLGELVEGRDAATAGHCERLVTYSLAIAEGLQLKDAQREALGYGGYLHDVGKVAIPDAVLLKPGRLTRQEYAQMKEHVILGWKLVSNLPSMEDAGQMVLHHHERFNGTGYPHGLEGEQIPITARILALADVFDALITQRPYKDPYPLDVALEMIRRDTGSHFDPRVVDAFFRALARGTLNPEIEDIVGGGAP